MNEHELASSIATMTWGRLPARGFTPALEVASGDLLTVDTLSHEGLLEPGLHEDLDEAVRIATRRALRLLAPLGFDPATALAYLSAAADLHVSQVVDGVKGVHFRIRRADLADDRHLPVG